MPHQRLRKFNTRNVYRNVSIDNDMCMVVKAGRHIFLRGQTGFDLEGGFVGIGDAAAHVVERPLQIDGGRSRGSEGRAGFVERLRVVTQCDRDAVGSRGTGERGAADVHVMDRVRDLGERR